MFITKDDAIPLSLTIPQKDLVNGRPSKDIMLYTLLNELPKIKKDL